MKRANRRLNMQQALALFHKLGEEESDGGEISDLSDVDWSDKECSSDSDDEPEGPLHKKSRTNNAAPVLPAVPTIAISTPLVPGPSPSHEQKESGKDGTFWKVIQPGGHSGRRQSQNLLTESVGPTEHAKRNIEDPLIAFLCILDSGTLQHIRDCTVDEAHRVGDSSWDMSVAELKAFIALLFVRGTYSKNIEMESFWSEDLGLPFFNTTMPRNRYREIMRYLRFDKKESRRMRLSSDKFALMAKVWERFIDNSITCYRPGANITVDKQLFPTKARCRFTHYMANEPDKFGIKFWLAVDTDSKYVVNGFTRPRQRQEPTCTPASGGERGDEAGGAIRRKGEKCDHRQFLHLSQPSQEPLEQEHQPGGDCQQGQMGASSFRAESERGAVFN